AVGRHHARARIRACRFVRDALGQDAAPVEGHRRRPLGPRRQRRTCGGEGARHGDSMTPSARAGLAAPATTNRLDETFARLPARGERALVAYVMAGDPSLAETQRLVVEAERRGADVIELGVPFSDPLADGPVVQRAGARALAAGASLPRVLETVATLRAQVNVPLALMSYYNPILAFGLKSFARTAVDAGADGVI